MKVLVVEDDFISRKVLQKLLVPYGDCDIAVDGTEALQAFRAALDEQQPYDLVCLDIMMPKMDGHVVLQKVREIEREREVPLENGVKIIMTSALDDSSNVLGAFREGCEGYIVKPILKDRLLEELQKLGFLDE